jgi:hypothetical protein
MSVNKEGSKEMQSETNFRSANRATDTGWIGTFLCGIGTGAALMYLFDPDRGRGRRARLSDQLTSKVNRLGEAAESKARDLRNRAQGLIHEAGSLLPGGSSSTEQPRQNNEQSNTEGAARSASAGGGQGA